MNVNTIDNKANNPEASKTASIWASVTKNKKLCWFLLFVAVVFAVMNWLTPMITDDYFYMFHSFHGKCDGTHPIQTPWDVVTSQIDHYLWHNGRMAVHVTLQSIDALCGKWLFNLLNPLWFVAYILLTVRFATGRYGFRPVVAMVFILLWVMPIFNELYLWMAGSLNYLWASVVVVWFLIQYPKHEHRSMSWKSAGWLLFALLAGWTSVFLWRVVSCWPHFQNSATDGSKRASGPRWFSPPVPCCAWCLRFRKDSRATAWC